MTFVLNDGVHEVGGRKVSHFFLGFFAVILLFAGIWQIQSSAMVDMKKARELRLALPGEVIPPHGFGFKMVEADLYWIRLLQDIDYKESKEVRLGVIYKMLDAITILDPRFYVAYTAGLSSLSVLVGDTEGARRLYERAIENYPHDWHILFAAGYHNLYEVGDCARAATLFSNAAAHGAPYWVGFLAEKLYTRTGQYNLAKAALQDAYNSFKDEAARKAISVKLSDLEKNRDASNDSDKSPLVKCKPN